MRKLALVLVVLTLAGARSHAQQSPRDLIRQIEALQEQQDALLKALDAMLPPDTVPVPCTYTVSPTAPPAVTDGGGMVPLAITTQPACSWGVAAPDTWAQPDVKTGVGDATTTVKVEPNTAATPRSSDLTVAGVAVKVQQAGMQSVKDAAGLTAALKAKQPIIWLAPGTYTGNFTITAPVVLTGSPSVSGRVSPPDVAQWQLVAGDPLKPVLTIPPMTPAVVDVTLRGFTVTGVAKDRTAIVIGGGTTDVAQVPTRITVDQLAVLGVNGYGHRGVEAHGAEITITNSYIAGWLEQGRQSQGIYGVNGPGPYLIQNNYIEASGENILFGGDDPKIQNNIPSDITITNNTLYKPAAWRQLKGSVANSFELKCARRVTFTANTIDGNWKDIQAGHTIVLTARNQYGNAPWCLVDEVTIRDNTMRNAYEPGTYAVNILGNDNNHPSGQTQTITIDHNLFEDSPQGVQIQRGVIRQFTLTRNTFPKITGNWIYFIGVANGVPIGGFTPSIVNQNVTKSGQYGIFSGGMNLAPGTPTLAWWSNGNYTLAGNVIEKTAARTISWPPGNTLLAPGALAGMLDANFHYTPDPSVGW